MKRLTLLSLLLLLSCSGSSANVTDISESNGETYFTVNGNKAEFMGIFGQSKNPLMWKVTREDIVAAELVITKTASSRKTSQYDTDNNRFVKADLTDQEAELLHEITTNVYYRVYTAGTNGKHDKIMEILYYSRPDSSSILADIIVNISSSSVEIR